MVLVILLYLTHLYTKDFSSPYQKPISGDALSYYAYLPAIFIHQSSEYKFITDYEKKYYAESQRKNYLNTTKNGKKVNKTFPGVAILYLPFFLLAHFLASISGLDADGYSLIYQYLFDFGYWFYVLMGAIFYVKTLVQLKFKSSHIHFTLLLLLLGTNMLFYSVVDQSVTHIHNFFMINALIFNLLKFKNTYIKKYLFYSIALLVLIGITRPTNVIVLLLIPIFISSKQFYINLFRQIFKLKNVLIISLIVFIIGSIPFILWQWQTGNWIVYGYGKEGFDFSNPEVFNFLWSYKKGWFLYTPLALLVLIFGGYYLLKENLLKTILVFIFYAVSIFIFSSWWCWYYGAGMGQRVMIDHFILIGYLFLIVLKNAPILIKNIVIGLSLFLLLLNSIQTYQIAQGIYPMGSPNKTIYWDNFLSLTKKAKVYNKSNWKLQQQTNIILNSKQIIKGRIKQDGVKKFLQTSSSEKYSPTFEVGFIKPTYKIVISFTAKAQNNIDKSRLVITTNSQQKVIYLKPFLKKNKSIEMEFEVNFNQPIDSLAAYFWNASTSEKVDYYNLKVESYKE